LQTRHKFVAPIRYDRTVASTRDRRRFLAEVTLVGTSVVLSACGSDAPTVPAAPEGRVGTISLNHGHRAVITAAALQAGGALTLEIQGESIHGHALELTGDEVARIRRNEAVTVPSAPGWEDKHIHFVTFNA
jgi:hypothetical protein